MQNQLKSSIFKNVNISIFGAGVLFSLIQFGINRSMWSDEVFVALNIMKRDFSGLLKPLDYNAVAPILFLQLEKIASIILPNSEFGFRILPLFSYWITIYFFLKLLRLYFVNTTVITVCFAMFTLNSTLIYYSSETKQYMTDVLALTTFYYYLLSEKNNHNKKLFIISVLGIFFIFLSNVAPIILFSGGIYLLYLFRKNQNIKLKYLLVIISTWIMIFIGYYVSFIYGHPSKTAMVNYWEQTNSFLPLNPFKDNFYKFYVLKVGSIIKSLFNYGNIGTFIVFAITMLGTTKVKDDKRKRWILLFTPITIHLTLSALKEYPVETRLMLYILPCAIIVFGFGFMSLLDKSKISNKYAKQLSVLIIIFFVGFLLRSGIKDTHNIKASIKFIETNRDSRDKIYVSALATLPFELYQRFGFTLMNGDYLIFGERTIFWNGENWDFNQNKFKKELDRLKGTVWFVFTDVGDEKNKILYLEQYCRKKRMKLKNSSKNIGSQTYLYEFR